MVVSTVLLDFILVSIATVETTTGATSTGLAAIVSLVAGPAFFL